jgi:hypothetical protein
MWGAASLLVLSWLCFISRGFGGTFQRIYPVALIASLGLVTWTGYRGGQISQGENHLTEFMPNGLRKVLGVRPDFASDVASANDGTFYAARIQPIFVAQCLSCHGREKRKGGLQLDSYMALMHGGKHGAAVKPGDLRSSDLYRRITLSPGNDDFMPKGGKPPLSADQVKLIELWIASGASRTAKLDSFKDAPSGGGSVVREVKFEKRDMAEVARKRAEIASALTNLQQRFPDLIEYESRASADLVLNASLLGSRFGDRDLGAFAPVESHIVVADFTRTGITDESGEFIAGMKALRVLRLGETHIGDRTLESIAGLDQLASLSIFETDVTPAALASIQKMHSLRICYAGQTAISERRAIPAGITTKLIF